MPRANVKAPETFVLHLGESRVYAMEFAAFPELADNLETLTGTPTVSVDPTGSLTVGAPSISGTQVRFRVNGGALAGATEKYFLFSVSVATSGSNTLKADGELILTD